MLSYMITIAIFSPPSSCHQRFIVKFYGIRKCFAVNCALNIAVSHKYNLNEHFFFCFISKFIGELFNQL